MGVRARRREARVAIASVWQLGSARAPRANRRCVCLGWFKAPEHLSAWIRFGAPALGAVATYGLYAWGRIYWQAAFVIPVRQRDEARAEVNRLQEELDCARAPAALHPDVARAVATIQRASITLTEKATGERVSVALGQRLVESAARIAQQGLTWRLVEVWLQKAGYPRDQYDMDWARLIGELRIASIVRSVQRPGEVVDEWDELGKRAIEYLRATTVAAARAETDDERALTALRAAALEVRTDPGGGRARVELWPMFVAYSSDFLSHGVREPDVKRYLQQIGRARMDATSSWDIEQLIGPLVGAGVLGQRKPGLPATWPLEPPGIRAVRVLCDERARG